MKTLMIKTAIRLAQDLPVDGRTIIAGIKIRRQVDLMDLEQRFTSPAGTYFGRTPVQFERQS